MMVELTFNQITESTGNVVNFYEYAARFKRQRPRSYSFEESLIMLGGYNIVSLSEHKNRQ